MPSPLKHLAAVLAALTLSLTPVARAQSPRIAAVSTARVALTNTVSPRLKSATDLGAAPSDRTLSSVTLRFNMTAAQSSALDALLAAQQNPQSSQYHQWLTPEQFADQFGLSSTDIGKVTSWLTSQGLTVTGTARSRTFITVSGNVAQLQSAFATSIHSVTLDGEQHIAAITEPTLPASIAAVTSTITGLSDLRLKPRARPRFTSSITGSHFIAPGDLYTIYDMNPLLSNSVTGAGITIAVAGQTDILLSDIAAFRSASGLPANAPTVKVIGTDPGTPTTNENGTVVALDQIEASLDVEWSGAAAPGASILYVNSTDVIGTSLAQIIDQNLAPIATVSYGDCEANFGSQYIASFNALFRQANAQGQTIAGPTGDTGATDCDYDSTVATQGLAVDFPASSPYVTAVGGTMFNEGAGSYWSTTNGSTGGSALSYIPELPWNETSATNGLASGGGGASAYFTKPAWQIGTGVPADSSRDVPDVVFNAAAIHDPYLFCQGGFCTNGFRNASNGLDAVGGTSVATPIFAGIMGLLEQKIATRVGNANPTIYALANSPTYYTSVFHDITTGNNDSPCTIGTPNCTAIIATCNGLSNTGQGCIGQTANAGYDLASGWGSLDVFNYVNDFTSVTPLSIGTNGVNVSATTLTSTSATVTAGASVSFTATVASATSGVTTTPTGSAQLLVDGVATGSPVILSGGSATFTDSTTNLSSGSHVFTAAYSGDTTYAGSKGTFTLDVISATAADFTLTPATTTVTTKSGTTATGVTYTVTSVNGFSGPVAFTATSTSTSLYASAAFSVTPVTVTSGGTATTVFTLYAYESNASTSTGQIKFGKVSAANHSPLAPWTIPATGVTLAGLALMILPRRRSRWTALVLTLVSIGILGASGCSSTGTVRSTGGTTTTGTTNATAGTYPIVVTATGTNAAGTPLSHSVNISFVVQ